MVNEKSVNFENVLGKAFVLKILFSELTEKNEEM